MTGRLLVPQAEARAGTTGSQAAPAATWSAPPSARRPGPSRPRSRRDTRATSVRRVRIPRRSIARSTENDRDDLLGLSPSGGVGRRRPPVAAHGRAKAANATQGARKFCGSCLRRGRTPPRKVTGHRRRVGTRGEGKLDATDGRARRSLFGLPLASGPERPVSLDRQATLMDAGKEWHFACSARSALAAG